ncbi:proteasome activator pa28 REG alpha beta subunit [Rhodocollybia butyracea]|uniref:Proteasome activator pa28 REG alpha beta subunit n=1 Tax=Rhodocollybia butyracea TaxID=206335 RepID=A0A9P5Q7I4_9AGAR|nr:proteasome activator pa28 REG alpha beta subunit [Rhodocollybia butyracea]
MDKDLSTQVEIFNTEARIAGSEVVFSKLPRKVDRILRLEQLILSTSNIDSPFRSRSDGTDTTVYPPPLDFSEEPSKKRKTSIANSTHNESSRNLQSDIQYARFPNLVLENKHVKSVQSIIKAECEELISYIDTVNLWVSSVVPKIEDGDNFGVGVLLEIMGELQRAQECAYNLRDKGLMNHLGRAKICSKLIKYPFIEDYTSALKEYDDKQIYLARQSLYDLRSLYATLTDITQKNIAKIHAPRSNNGSGLY